MTTEQLSAQTAVKTEQPSLSDAEISKLILEAESGMPYSARLQAVPLTTVIALVRRILAQRQDSEQSRLMLADDTSPKIPARQDSDKDAERFRWIEENCHTEGGGKGFTIFVPVDHEDIGCGIDIAIANGAPK